MEKEYFIMQTEKSSKMEIGLMMNLLGIKNLLIKYLSFNNKYLKFKLIFKKILYQKNYK